jgi:hypothetical protein
MKPEHEGYAQTLHADLRRIAGGLAA